MHFKGSLLDFLKSDEGNRLQLPKLIDFSAQVSLAVSVPFHSAIILQFLQFFVYGTECTMTHLPLMYKAGLSR